MSAVVSASPQDMTDRSYIMETGLEIGKADVDHLFLLFMVPLLNIINVYIGLPGSDDTYTVTNDHTNPYPGPGRPP